MTTSLAQGIIARYNPLLTDLFIYTVLSCLMPTYIYQCENCGVRFDRHQKFSEKPLTVCPECSKKTLRKIFTPVGIVFKGSGFYATDHRSPSGGPSKNGSGADDSGSENKSKDVSKGTEKKEAKKESNTESKKPD